MTASDHVSPHQLSMFLPARELYGMHSLDTAAFGGDVGRMRSAKRRVNAMSKLSDVSEGINKPVQLIHGQDESIARFKPPEVETAVANGNHRVTAAYDQDPDMEVPVEHYDSGDKLFGAMRRQDESGW
jgi:hypothetical protein